MTSSAKPSESKPSRPWILSASYWNDVAKDTVKAVCVALAIYLAGVLGGIFKLHVQILYIALALVAPIFLYVLPVLLFKRTRSGLAGIIVGSIAGGLGVAWVSSIASTTWHVGDGWEVLISVGAGMLIFTAGAILAERVWRTRGKDGQPDEDKPTAKDGS